MDDGSPRLTVRLRREIAQALSVEDLFLDASEFERLLDRLWILDDDPLGIFSQSSNSLRTRIRRHVFENPGDWTVEELFKALGAYDCSDRRFSTFVEILSSSRIRPSEAGQRRFVDIVNRVLVTGDVELREVEHEEGYPAFRVVAKSGVVSGRPKNLIFASPRKPDIRFLDAITNDIEIASNPADVLVYDRPIPSTGLNWRDLQSWWAETNAIADQEQAKRSLYKRLLDSLPNSSPPQKAFFEAYFKAFSALIPGLPALLPEVWLHWDPKTVKERGATALTRFRMDFLLLLPWGRRVVVEIDGKQHYADGERASPTRYAEMVAADRDLRLTGYDVFRFGTAELKEPCVDRVKEFFTRLFIAHSLGIHLQHQPETEALVHKPPNSRLDLT
jgi:hypothetical protein